MKKRDFVQLGTTQEWGPSNSYSPVQGEPWVLEETQTVLWKWHWLRDDKSFWALKEYPHENLLSRVLNGDAELIEQLQTGSPTNLCRLCRKAKRAGEPRLRSVHVSAVPVAIPGQKFELGLGRLRNQTLLEEWVQGNLQHLPTNGPLLARQEGLATMGVGDPLSRKLVEVGLEWPQAAGMAEYLLSYPAVRLLDVTFDPSFRHGPKLRRDNERWIKQQMLRRLQEKEDPSFEYPVVRLLTRGEVGVAICLHNWSVTIPVLDWTGLEAGVLDMAQKADVQYVIGARLFGAAGLTVSWQHMPELVLRAIQQVLIRELS